MNGYNSHGVDCVMVDPQELATAIKVMASKLEDLQTCNDLILKHGNALQVIAKLQKEN